MIYFISGHRDLTLEEFNKYYKPTIFNAFLEASTVFIVADYEGADYMAQDYLAELSKTSARSPYLRPIIIIYHMGSAPKYLAAPFETIGGFTTDEQRDSAMTLNSTKDIAFIRPGKEGSGTAQNILRRYKMK